MASFLGKGKARKWNLKSPQVEPNKEENSVSGRAQGYTGHMDHDELVAAMPRLREEATRADARLHAATQRIADTAEVLTYVEVHEDYLVVDVRGIDRLFRVLSRLRLYPKTARLSKIWAQAS